LRLADSAGCGSQNGITLIKKQALLRIRNCPGGSQRDASPHPHQQPGQRQLTQKTDRVDRCTMWKKFHF